MSSQAEDEYFKREDAEKLHRIHADKLKAAKAADLDKLKELHWMKCSKCGWDLETVKWRGVQIEKCFHCGAVVLDDGELETLAGDEHDQGFLRTFFELFKKGE